MGRDSATSLRRPRLTARRSLRAIWTLVLTAASTLVPAFTVGDGSASAADIGCEASAGAGTHCYVKALLPHDKSTGIAASLSAPFSLPDVTADGYSITQLSIQRIITKDRNKILESIEFGWLVNPYKYGNPLSHLFLAARFPDGSSNSRCILGVPNLSSDESRCPFNLEDLWHPLGSKKHLGEPVYGTDFYHIGHYDANHAWWVQYGNEWLGYVQESYFAGGFPDATDLLWFGEVAYDKNPCVPMGNGTFGSVAGSARISGMVYEARDKKQPERNPGAPLYTSRSSSWDYGNVTSNSFTYGGPGCAGAR
jgi:neprosin-like protein